MKDRKIVEAIEHFTNDNLDAGRALLKQFIIEQAREIHAKFLQEDEDLHAEALEGDQEKDLTDDLNDIESEYTEESEVDHDDMSADDAEKDLADDLLAADEESSEEVDADEEEHHHDEEEHHDEEAEEEKIEEIEDRVEDLETSFEELQKMFDDLDKEVDESVELQPVKVNKEGEVGVGKDRPVEVNTVSPVAKEAKAELKGEPVEIGKGDKVKNFDRQEPTVKAKDLGKFNNSPKSSKDALAKVEVKK